jgi:DNA-binding transcriptional LysR family regulator
MGVPRSTVSLHIQSLEASLDLRLFKRSTRSLVLTEEGQQLHAMAQAPLDHLAQGLHAMQGQHGALSGLIRLTLPADFPTEVMASAITSFRRQHPLVRFQILHTGDRLDLVARNIDIALRMGDGSPPDAVERSVLEIDWMICASADWVERHGLPDSLAELGDDRTGITAAAVSGAAGAFKPLPEPAIEVDSLLMARSLVLEGFGCALLPAGMVQPVVEQGLILRLLPMVTLSPTRLKLAFPTRADMIPRVRAFCRSSGAGASGVKPEDLGSHAQRIVGRRAAGVELRLHDHLDDLLARGARDQRRLDMGAQLRQITARHAAGDDDEFTRHQIKTGPVQHAGKGPFHGHRQEIRAKFVARGRQTGAAVPAMQALEQGKAAGIGFGVTGHRGGGHRCVSLVGL